MCGKFLLEIDTKILVAADCYHVNIEELNKWNYFQNALDLWDGIDQLWNRDNKFNNFNLHFYTINKAC